MGVGQSPAPARDDAPVTPRPAVSVVMPVYNGVAHVGEALDSVLRQTFDDFEVVAVDDGSSDDSWAMLCRYAERDARIRAHRLPLNRGHHVASNTALDRAVGRFIVRLDQDDLAAPTRLARTVAVFEADPSIGLVHSHYVRLLPDGRRLVRTPPGSDAALRITQKFRNTVCHSALAVRSETLNALDERYRDLPGPQDYDLIVRLLRLTRSHCIPESLAVYRQESMAMTEQYSDRMERAVEEISDGQLTEYLPLERTGAARRMFNLTANDGDRQSVRNVRAVFARTVEVDPLIDADEAAEFGREWTRRAMRAALAPHGGLPRSARVLGELVRGDPLGAAGWVRAEAVGGLRRLTASTHRRSSDIARGSSRSS